MSIRNGITSLFWYYLSNFCASVMKDRPFNGQTVLAVQEAANQKPHKAPELAGSSEQQRPYHSVERYTRMTPDPYHSVERYTRMTPLTPLLLEEDWSVAQGVGARYPHQPEYVGPLFQNTPASPRQKPAPETAPGVLEALHRLMEENQRMQRQMMDMHRLEELKRQAMQ